MGINSTDTAYAQGKFGSTYLTGSGAKLDLSMATSKYYISSITIVETTEFTNLDVLDGGVNSGIGKTYFASTDGPFPIDTDWAGDATADVTNESGNDSDQIASANAFPAGITIYGMYDKVILNSGACIVYVAPRPDYNSRA